MSEIDVPYPAVKKALEAWYAGAASGSHEDAMRAVIRAAIPHMGVGAWGVLNAAGELVSAGNDRDDVEEVACKVMRLAAHIPLEDQGMRLVKVRLIEESSDER